ncbi:MAG: restriction endonuclease [Methanomicrobiales archaeon]|nr:restriction endonuclease [Methanomicrobiales archaeon]
MTARTNYTKGREVEYLARDLLVAKGYQVLRSTGPHSPVDLVAWLDHGHTLFVQVRRNKIHLDGTEHVAQTYQNDIRALRTVARPTGSTAELWVWSSKTGWHFYSVLPGGIWEVIDHGM